MQKSRASSESTYFIPYLPALKACWVVFIILYTFIDQAHSQALSLEADTGASGGWWYYTQGTIDDAFDTQKGNAYTESTLMLSFETNIRYTVKRFDVGAGLNYTLFAEDEMFSIGNHNTSLNSFEISKNAVTFFKMYLLTSYALVRSGDYTLSPQIKAGIFTIQTTHPDKGDFGHKTFWEAGIRNEISFPQWRLMVSPYFNTMTIQPREPTHEGEHHKIYSLGIMFGTLLPLYKK